MDLGILLDATEDIQVPFAGETVNLTIYSMGAGRLTAEQRQPIAELFNGETDRLRYAQLIEAARLSLPLLVKEWDVTWRGEPLPIEAINELDENQNRKYPIPDDFLIAINDKIRQVTALPTNGSEPPRNGSQPADKLESHLVESISP